jgi:hypothetical protein
MMLSSLQIYIYSRSDFRNGKTDSVIHLHRNKTTMYVYDIAVLHVIERATARSLNLPNTY